MAKLRVYELARHLGVESKDLMERAAELGVEVRTASSGLGEDEAELLRLSYVEPSDGEAEPASVPSPEPEPEVATLPVEGESVQFRPGITVGEFAEAVGESPATVVKALMEMGEMISASQAIPTEALGLLAEHFEYRAPVGEVESAPIEAPPAAVAPQPQYDDRPEDLRPRPPVVTVMGHVDHGKTRLLDAIRKTNVVAGEAGGITQHIGAYQVELNGRPITFIDTPGHEAFTALRARGAQVTDIVVLVVAADDGVMPQTAEAISHAKAAGVPIVVAINKIDLAQADPDRVRAQLTEHDLVAEQLGGETITVEVSALENQGIEQLLEMLDLVAEVEDFRANPEAPASGTVIEGQLDVGRGPVGTVIVQRGTLRVGDSLVAGPVAGRVRAMLNDLGEPVKEVSPSAPVLIMGWDDVPQAGDYFRVVADDREARNLAQARVTQVR
ncbi:MAG: translation initiation factor IF-2, partial [Acidimicrobiia bacterium]